MQHFVQNRLTAKALCDIISTELRERGTHHEKHQEEGYQEFRTVWRGSPHSQEHEPQLSRQVQERTCKKLLTTRANCDIINTVKRGTHYGREDLLHREH